MASISIPVPWRARAKSGLLGWLATVDHKKIGLMYMVMAFSFFIGSGILGLLIRVQLAAPNQTFLDPQTYNQVFTMHGTGMIFLFTIPMVVGGFGNYFLPLMIGARDVAFPRLNAFSFWITLGGGLVMAMAFVLGARSDASWIAYVPYSNKQYSPTLGMDIWLIGLILTGVGSTLGAVNFLVTVYTMRAPGMTTWRIPMFVWAMVTTAAMVLLATPVLTAALLMLVADRNFSTQFFTANNARLWQHMFWFYSHPAVYIMILPVMGIVSEILPVFSRKPLFGAKAVVISTILIGILGFTTWVHHMFVSGVDPVIERFFMFTTMVIAVPTGVKVFNWLATMWGGSIDLKTPMLMAIGFLAMFVIGGLSGVIQALVPVNQYVHNSYWVVAHFHYVLFGGAVFGIFAGLYYWVPKMLGRMFDERLGKLHFVLMFIGFNLTFFPMHILGLMGMPRRIATYMAGRGWETGNLIATIGAFIIALSLLVFFVNVIKLRHAPKAGNDPWEGNTLEWTIPSPPPEYNFRHIPVVESDRPAYDERMRALPH
ncbi:MAG: cytochrome c oxidase subunit I [Thermoflexales bacterium]|nr:cytochrome c oxidase subunit I [Thermoflexales bacterium]MCS7323743.1 cytochrome c oxidase subunit I [Thermoflexales bacterium]MCX7939700.1 cytochrome c oxidase subunit I [Thermoflexales bacterium]MDW8054735.1 cytochrome c oxidase subunit I [Anaerolineae bacterium]MDW8292556.1 cytochrome c oxidase subunit I [Anaerolineae bacterium]